MPTQTVHDGGGGGGSQEIGKVAFRAHFPRDYPITPPTLLLTEELIHPNWQFPAKGLQVPHLTKEGWDSNTTIPKVRWDMEEVEREAAVSLSVLSARVFWSWDGRYFVVCVC